LNALSIYLKTMVEPTVDEFMRNPLSPRHAYIACVVTYHAIDRVTYGKTRDEEEAIKKDWREQSTDFAMIEVLALDLKHVKSKRHGSRPKTIPVGAVLMGTMGFNSSLFNDTGRHESLRNISFLVMEAVKFIQRKAELLEGEA